MQCEVIIPVGPGHEELYLEAVNSVRIAALISRGPFSEITVRVAGDTDGAKGRSKTRNAAAKESSAEWLFWLDADDLVTPDLFSIATDYIADHDAIFVRFGEIQDFLVIDRYQACGFSDYRTLLQIGEHATVKIGHFVRREVAVSYPFNVDMNAGEDWDYYLRVWKDARCVKANGPIGYGKRRGRHSKGPKGATGRDWNQAVSRLLSDARKALWT